LSKVLTARLDINTSLAEKKLQKVTKAITKLNTLVNGQSTKYAKLNTQISKMSNQLGKVNAQTKKVVTNTSLVKKNLKDASHYANNLGKTLMGALAAYTGIMGARAVGSTSDIITSSENRLNALNGSNETLTQETLDKMYTAAQKARSGYSDMMNNVSKSMTLAPDAFQGNIDNAIRFQEIMGKAYTIGGASAAEKASSMYQMVQALGSGILQGDELRSVREGAPIAYQQIEKFAQGVFNTEESLKDLASQGKITSDIVVAAMMDAGESIDKAFEDTSMTFAQFGTSIKNVATKAFEPFLQKLNDILNKLVASGIMDKLAVAFQVAANIAIIALTALENAITWLGNNWDWVSNLLISGLITIIGLVAVLTAIWLIGFIMANWVVLLVVGAIMLVIFMLLQCGLSVEQVVGGICGAIMFVVYLIVAIVQFIYNIVIALLTLLLIGVIWLGAGIGLIIQAIVQIVLWAITSVKAIFVTLCNIIYSVFKGAWGAVKWFIVQTYSNFVKMGNGILEVIKSIAGAIDFVFGSNLANTVQGWQDGLSSSVIALEAKLDPKGEFEDIGNQWKTSYSDLRDQYAGRGKYDDWNITDNMSNLVNGAVGLTGDTWNLGEDLLVDLVNPMDGWNKGYEFGSKTTTNLEEMIGSFSSQPFDTQFGDINGGSYDPSKALKGIGDDTSDIADAVSLTEEDLKYLRDVANMEWKKEFTTANIVVDMKNTNTINNSGDLDGWVETLTNKLYEELDMVADGVYA
jgi:tape measure domain-containing protein